MPVERIELPTFGLQNRCSTAELNRQLVDARNPFYRVYLPLPGADGAGRRQISELSGEGYWHDAANREPPGGTGCIARFTVRVQRAWPTGEAPVEGVGLAGVCDRGSRARAMATRQASCELETVPSLHSNLGDAASTTGGGFAVTAAC